MYFDLSHLTARSILSAINIQLSIEGTARIPQDVPVIVVSNHRSFLDAPILIASLPYPLRIACHHYMGEAPGIRQVAVDLLGCFPLAESGRKKKQFFDRASELLAVRQWVGLFPEGTKPMVEPTKPNQLGKFERGFAHLAWRVPVSNLAVLPIAIAALDETIYPTIPIRWLKRFDREEPFFDRSGSHPMIIYHRVRVAIGHPYWIGNEKKEQYQGKQAKKLALDLTNHCHTQISELLNK
ncbi:1-acyl-sn-glycerol-3-phosphate acyltransferase [Myxosarcina sp. GI1]|uniref:lysophospholipid acyltransferase family protein n=1 Tax=Myxosarcina sp. GI1 TaxID=1541065 RepID=UPI00055BDDCD|nr:lysophospholipid acyltransferase family protein [Myxosarcina sp. GI1]